MKLTFLSDTHGHESDVKIEPCDILIHTGDIDARDLVDVKHFHKWFSNQDAKHRVFVPGNHDFFFESHLQLCRDTMTNTHVLVNQAVEIEGFKFWGSPITPEFFNWAFMAGRGEEIKQYWDMIPDDTDIILTHGPVYGILDYVDRSAEYVGCKDLSIAVARIQPIIHACGHIHCSYGIDSQIWEPINGKKHKTTFINSALMSERYKLTNKPITIEI
jgi:Icc-related predicted phosphoesterase